MGRLNKPALEGYRYRSPGQTNAKDATPNLREDVNASQRADNERIRRGLNADADRANNRRTQQEAGGRAITRTGSRMGLAGLAGEAGYAVGRKLDEETGVGKKMANELGLGDAAEKIVNRRNKVELSKGAKEQLNDMEIEDTLREVDRDAKATKEYSGKDKPSQYRGDDEPAYKRGGGVKKMASGGSASKRADGIAQRGKTRA